MLTYSATSFTPKTPESRDESSSLDKTGSEGLDLSPRSDELEKSPISVPQMGADPRMGGATASKPPQESCREKLGEIRYQ